MQQTHLPTTQVDPPPYEDSLDSESDASDAEADEDEHSPHQPLKLCINAASSVHGCNNVVQTPPPPFADISKFSTLLLHAMNQISAASNTSKPSPRRRQRTLKVDLTINCGITVIGDRNVVGGIGLRHKAAIATVPGSSTATNAPDSDAVVIGAKRKADDVSNP
jgi:hypothetical protein